MKRGAISPAGWLGALLLAGTLIGLAGCGPGGWRVDVVNETRALVVRVVSAEGTWSWLIAGGQTILDRDAPLVGTLELLDPETCVVYDKIDLPATSFTAMTSTTVSDPPGYEIAVILDDVSEDGPVRDPDPSLCRSAGVN